LNISNNIAAIILEMLERDGMTEIQRNVLAQTLGCVPSQINYVIASRFTPEHGYIVESRRGGGGYIRISRIKLGGSALLMHAVNSIGSAIDERSCRAHILNLHDSNALQPQAARLMLAATADGALREVPPASRDAVRAAVFKNMLLCAVNQQQTQTEV